MSSCTSSTGNVDGLKCYCGFKVRILTAKTSLNYGRRFFRCPSYNEISQRSSCSYFEWIDEPFNGRARDVIRGLVKEKDEATTHIRSLKDSLNLEKLHNIRLQEQLQKMIIDKHSEGLSQRMKKMVGGRHNFIYFIVVITAAYLFNMKW